MNETTLSLSTLALVLLFLAALMSMAGGDKWRGVTIVKPDPPRIPKRKVDNP